MENDTTNIPQLVLDQFHTASYTMIYMSICFTCCVWQLLTAARLVCRTRKLIHIAVLFEVFLALFSILCSLLAPVTDLSCDFASIIINECQKYRSIT